MVGSYWLPIGNHTLRRSKSWPRYLWSLISQKPCEMAGSLPNLHTMVHRRTRIQGVLKVNVKVKGHVIRTHLWFHENRFFSQANGWNTTKVAHDRHPRCAQGQGRGKRSPDTGTSVMSRNVCYTVLFGVLSLHALTLRSSTKHSPSTISIRQLDVMSTSWNELLRHWRSGCTFRRVRSPLTWYINFSFVAYIYNT